MSEKPILVANGAAVPLRDVPVGEFSWLRSLILEKIAGGARLAALCPFAPAGRTLLAAVMASAEDRGLAVAAAPVGDSFSSLTPECPAAHLFEREIAEERGIVPLGHPWLKPVRFPPPRPGKPDPRLPESFSGKGGPSVMEFFRIEGEEVHEVAVGPVHAGVIEPGHFRFQCHGEKVMHLEISLGYQHRGIGKALIGGPNALTRHFMETAAGDTACGHGLAYAMNVEALSGLAVSEPAHRVRAIGLELERIANHVGDLGALSGDVGFLPVANYCGRLRGDILNLTAAVCGNRFGRGLVLPGGTGFGIDAALAGTMRTRLDAAMRDIRGALKLLFNAPTVSARFEGTGGVARSSADHLGLVGPAARASGLETDIRLELPHGMYRPGLFEPGLGANGDVMDRARQRRIEVEISAGLIAKWLGEDCAAVPADAGRGLSLRPESLAVSLTEGWRGQICHVAATGADGKFLAYKVVDPSFHNWSGLAMALRGQQISDFPLCNKSFNLSYCGHDL